MLRNPPRLVLLGLLYGLSATTLTGCASLWEAHHEGPDAPAPANSSEKTPNNGEAKENKGEAKAEAKEETAEQKLDRMSRQQKDMAALLAASNAKLEALEIRMATLNDKLDATRSNVDNVMSSQKSRPQSVSPRVNDAGGTPLVAPMAASDPEAGFVSDQPIQRYRKAMILFESKSYSDAVLAFSTFVDQYPDHALAGSAQYYLAESYFNQGEYRLAAREYQRVLTTYDRSPHVADTLRRVADCEDRLQQPQAAAKHREQLAALFPSSPAANQPRERNVRPVATAPEPVVAPVPEAPAEKKAHGEETATKSPAKFDEPLDSPPPTAPAAAGGTAAPAPGEETPAQ